MLRYCQERLSQEFLPPPHFYTRSYQDKVVTRHDAEAVLDKVSAALAEAGYDEVDLTKMRLAMEEALGGAMRSCDRYEVPAKQLLVRYRVNVRCVAAEVEIVAAGPDPMRESSLTENRGAIGLTKPPRSRLFLTWVRYSKQDQAATLCECRMIQ